MLGLIITFNKLNTWVFNRNELISPYGISAYPPPHCGLFYHSKNFIKSYPHKWYYFSN